MPSKTDIAWLAGLLEGEGCFRLHEQSKAIRERHETRPQLVVQLVMTDKDVVEKAIAVLPSPNRHISIRRGIQSVKMPSAVIRKTKHLQDQYQIAWSGASAEALMKAVLPFMGGRRRTKIEEMLNAPNLAHTPRVKDCTICGARLVRCGGAARKGNWYCDVKCKRAAARAAYARSKEVVAT